MPVVRPIHSLPPDSILARAALGTARVVGNVCRWCHRRRYELTPAAASATLTSLAWLQHNGGMGVLGHLAYGAATAVTAAAGGLALKHKHKTFATAAGCAAVVSADTWIAAGAGPSIPSLIASGIVTGGAYVPYMRWLTANRQTALKLQVEAAKAGVSAEAMGAGANYALTGATAEETKLMRALVAMLSIPAVDVSSLERTVFGWRAVVVLPAGRDTAPAKVIARREQLATNIGLPGKLRLAKGETDNELVVCMYESDPLAETLPWRGPTTTTCLDPAVLGMDAFGLPVEIPMLYNHVLIGGASDNGKSSLQAVLIAYAAACADADLVLIDLKPGAVELGPWASCSIALADSAQKALTTLEWLWEEVQRRGELLAELGRQQGKPVKRWIPGVHGNAIFVFIDELAELMRQLPGGAKILESLLQVARFVGITLVCATQSPSNRVFGGTTDGRQQYQVRIGMGAKESTTANLIFGPGAYGDGWCLDELEGPGYFLRWDRDNRLPVVSRAFFMTEEDISATNHRYGLDAPVEAREHPTHDHDPDDTPTPPRPPTPPGGGGPGRGRPVVLRPVPVLPDGTVMDERTEALWRALEQAGPEGITIDNLVALGLPEFNARSSVNGPLSQWRHKGWVEEAGKQGRAMGYRLAPRTTAVIGAEEQTTAINEEAAACPVSL
ncbi:MULTISPECIES: FtsK/SpoIIIE domain-containing protein [unclassified Streptomyces]|uniref:FtsK/SpoIIIE domain-containing protein n=1 Tax=unclassified Streptomyces TaxID=2593676 RepID=UPI00333156D0